MFEEKIDVCVRLKNYKMRWFGPKLGLRRVISDWNKRYEIAVV